MSRHGFSNASDDQLLALPQALASTPWSEVEAVALKPDTDPGALLSEPMLVALKSLLMVAIEALRMVSVPGDGLAPYDDRWDGAQRRLFFTLQAELHGPDDAHRAAAERLFDVFFGHSGLAIVQSSYEDEVAAGRAQVSKAAEPDVARDVTALGLDAHLEAVRVHSEALHEALREAANAGQSTRHRAARVLCHNTLNSICSQLTMLRDKATGAARERIDALLAPFKALVD